MRKSHHFTFISILFGLLSSLPVNATIVQSAENNAVAIETEPQIHIDKWFQEIKNLIKTDSRCGVSKPRLDLIELQYDLIKTKPIKLLETESNYEKYREQIEMWSLYDIDNRRDLKRYLSAEQTLINSLAKHYSTLQNLGNDNPNELADKVVKLLVSNSLNAAQFDLPVSHPQIGLRKLILDKGDISEIVKFTNKALLLEKPTYEGAFRQESILSIAVEYPKALEHLLSLGISPNHQNSFGKTPLMYAVQKNQYESVKLLIEYGTNKVRYHGYVCESPRISQYGVSALHYAARFASVEVISLLVASGAHKEIVNGVQHKRNEREEVVDGVRYRADDMEVPPSGTPYDWLIYFRKDLEDAKDILFVDYNRDAYREMERGIFALAALFSGIASPSRDDCGRLPIPRRDSNVALSDHEVYYNLLSHPNSAVIDVVGAKRSDEQNQRLDMWALQGIDAYDQWVNFTQTKQALTQSLTSFYEQQFQVPREAALTRAQTGIDKAIAYGFNFTSYPQYKSSEEIAIRKAILQNKPLEEIQDIDLTRVQRGNDNYYKESLLNIAIASPEILKYLLNNNFDPNTPNGFGKTPLMYAAQQNNIASAKLLINAKAKLNAGTIVPRTCDYALTTFDMTALHYAVRYASKEFIELLVNSGASLTLSALDSKTSKKERPIDWLVKFDNPNIDAAEKTAITKLLTPL